jgi:AcrR family transcriptional regulator
VIVPDTQRDRPTPRARLLEAADRLFYDEGICTVGVDRILKEADVARASLYTTYGSKDELVGAYLR